MAARARERKRAPGRTAQRLQREVDRDGGVEQRDDGARDVDLAALERVARDAPALGDQQQAQQHHRLLQDGHHSPKRRVDQRDGTCEHSSARHLSRHFEKKGGKVLEGRTDALSLLLSGRLVARARGFWSRVPTIPWTRRVVEEREDAVDELDGGHPAEEAVQVLGVGRVGAVRVPRPEHRQDPPQRHEQQVDKRHVPGRSGGAALADQTAAARGRNGVRTRCSHTRGED
eukprot:1111142-Pleurochrysis_carterae.AAC.3